MVMSLAKPLILSETGGNKYFKKYTSKGVFYFDITKENALAKAIVGAYEIKNDLAEVILTTGQH
mgnify:CR=1 FL=1